MNSQNDQEKVRCHFCHDTYFQLDLRMHKLCQCPASPIICTYCCFSKKQCFCQECGNRFDVQYLSQKANQLKQLEKERQESQSVGYNPNMPFSASQFFSPPIPNQSIDNLYQSTYNQMQMNSMSNYEDTYEVQHQQQQFRSRRQQMPFMTSPNQGQNLAQSRYFSPVKKEQEIINDQVLDAYNLSQSSTKEGDSNKVDFINSIKNSSKSIQNQRNNLTDSNYLLSESSRCDQSVSSCHQDYYQQQNAQNQPWNFNQQNNPLQNKQQSMNPFYQTNNLFARFNEGNNQNNNMPFCQNLTNQQNTIFENISSQINQIQQQPVGQNINQQPFLFQQPQQNIPQPQNSELNDKQSIQIDDNTVNELQHFQFFSNSNNSIQSRQNLVQKQPQPYSNHMKYIQNVSQPQKINTHLYQSLDPQSLSNSRNQSPNFGNNITNLRSSQFGQNAEYLTPKGWETQQTASNKPRNQLNQSLSLNDLADKQLNSSLNLDEVFKKNQSHHHKKEIRSYSSNKNIAQMFKEIKTIINSRPNSVDQSLNQVQKDNKTQDSNNHDFFAQLQKEREQLILGRNLFRGNHHQQNIPSQMGQTNQQMQQFTSPNNQLFGNNTQAQQQGNNQFIQPFLNQNQLAQPQIINSQFIPNQQVAYQQQQNLMQRQPYQPQQQQLFHPNQQQIFYGQPPIFQKQGQMPQNQSMYQQQQQSYYQQQQYLGQSQSFLPFSQPSDNYMEEM